MCWFQLKNWSCCCCLRFVQACLADLDGMTGLASLAGLAGRIWPVGLDGWSLHLKGLNVLVPAEELELLLLLEVCPYLAVMLLPAEVGEPVV